MELKDRVSAIIKENHLKQKELAALMGVTEGYVSALLSGRNRNVSVSAANLVEEKLGYNAQWLLLGDEPKYKKFSKNPNLSDIHRKVILQLERMPENEVKAVLAFINSLADVEKFLTDKS